ncbi:MAG: hypothetical protein IKA67_00270 [Clostridia bacterium]|nr:hypothetical protein [Clostridia bacterium]
MAITKTTVAKPIKIITHCSGVACFNVVSVPVYSALSDPAEVRWKPKSPSVSEDVPTVTS